jgi:hypothetical protein
MRGGGGEAEGATWGGRAGEAAVRGTDGRGGAGGQRAGRLEVARAGVPAPARVRVRVGRPLLLTCVCESGWERMSKGGVIWSIVCRFFFYYFFSRFYSAERGRHPN